MATASVRSIDAVKIGLTMGTTPTFPEHSNSKRFWRLNTITGLTVLVGGVDTSASPEEHAVTQERLQELRRLQAKEDLVQKRYTAMLQRLPAEKKAELLDKAQIQAGQLFPRSDAQRRAFVHKVGQRLDVAHEVVLDTLNRSHER
jgi:hypothetical protein